MSSLITLNDRSRVETAIKKMNSPLSEYCFANLYLFREIHQYELQGDFIKGVTRDKKEFYMPLSLPFEVKADRTYFPLVEEWMGQFKDQECRFELNPADEDYLFTRESMSTFGGRNLASQRNFIYRFEEDYDPTVKILEKEDIPDAYKILATWSSEQDLEEADESSCKEALDLMQELGLTGYIVRGGNEPLGFILGEIYQPDKAVYHFSKASHKIKGITPYMYHHFAKNLPSEIAWINLEQDLGLPGLAKGKSSYHPAQKLKKYYLLACSTT